MFKASRDQLLDSMASIPASLEQWLDHIQSIYFRSRVDSLDRVRRVRHILRLRRPPIVITVGGTNGQGSSIAILESVLQNAGHKVGTYTSPHLIEYRERIRIDGTDVGTDLLLQAFNAVETARQAIPLTFFRIRNTDDFVAVSEGRGRCGHIRSWHGRSIGCGKHGNS